MAANPMAANSIPAGGGGGADHITYNDARVAELQSALTDAVEDGLLTLKRQGDTDLIHHVGKHMLAMHGFAELVPVVSQSTKNLLGLKDDPDTRRLVELKQAYLKQLGAETRRLQGTPAQSALSQIDVTRLPKEAYHITGLIDDDDLPTLRMALLHAAGNPAHDELRPFAAADMTTWSNEHLTALPAQALTELQQRAGEGFSTPLNMPLNILSLAQMHGGQAIPDFIFPYDKYSLTHTAGDINEFVLDASIFSVATALNSAQNLQALRALIWPEDTSAETYSLLVSPLHSVTLPDAARARAAIPPSGAFYAFCHSPTTADIEAAAGSVIKGLVLHDPIVAWLLTGAYVYFDFMYDCVAVNALSFSTNEGSTSLFLGPACPLPAMAIEPLFDHQRWQRLPGPIASHYGFSKMAFVTPSEFLGDTIFSKSGGLAFLHEEDYTGIDHSGDGRIDEVLTTGEGKSRFFPIVQNDPLLEHPTVKCKGEGGMRSLTIARARIDEWPLEDALEAVRHFSLTKPVVQPMPYNAPLYISELSRRHASVHKAAAAFAGLNAAKFVEPPMSKAATTAIFAEGKSAALGLAGALGFEDGSALLHNVCAELGVTDQAAKAVAEERGCTVSDARWLEAIRKETERLVAHGAGGGAADSFSLEALHSIGAIWLMAQDVEAQRGERDELLQELLFNMRYVLDEVAREETVRGNDGASALRDRGHDGMTLADFAQMPPAKGADLSLSEVAGLRLYTSSTFRLINGPLRRQIKPHPLAATTMLISNALKKLRANHMKSDKTKFRTTFLWRGMRDMAVDANFLLQGGTELACMSTSSDLRVVAGYAASSTPLLFRIKVDSPMELGAEVSWVSLYPGESEWLYPPLSFIKPMFVQAVKGVDGSQVITVKPSFPS